MQKHFCFWWEAGFVVFDYGLHLCHQEWIGTFLESFTWALLGDPQRECKPIDGGIVPKPCLHSLQSQSPPSGSHT